MAASTTWGYGASGTDGFGTSEVRDRYHNLGHSDFFEEKFVRANWLPLINDNDINASDMDKQGAEPNWTMNLFRVPFNYLLMVLLIILLSIPFGVGRYFEGFNLDKTIIANNDSYSNTRGLAKTKSIKNSLIVYATQPNSIALDGEGENSPFANAIYSAIDSGVTDIAYIAERVKFEVNKSTRGLQTPYFLNTLEDTSLNLADKSLNKIAIVIGNSEYKNVPELKNPAKDANKISNAFATIGFRVFNVINKNKAEFESAFSRFLEQSKSSTKETVAIIYGAVPDNYDKYCLTHCLNCLN